MHIIFYFLALMSALVTALPTTAIPDGRGATIFTSTNLSGRSTAIPGNKFCTDLSNIFGNFDGKVRSLTVEKGFKCQFYVEYGCPVAGVNMEISEGEMEKLGKGFDSKIHSARCTGI